MVTDDRGVVEPGLLTETGKGGLFSEGYLAERPLETRLEPHEQPRLVFPSDGRGVLHVRGESETVIDPGSKYRTIVALTERRVVIGIGGGDRDGSDRVVTLSLQRIEHVAEATTGNRPVVRLWVGPDEAWVVSPAEIDTGTVATVLEDAATAWVRFERLTADARDALGDAARHRAGRAFDHAEDALDRAGSLLDAAVETAGDYGDSIAEMESRIACIRRRHRDERRRLIRARARFRQERARELWRREEYERAMDAIRVARTELAWHLRRQHPGERTVESIQRRLEQLDVALDRLRSAPIRCAIAFQRAAERADDPSDAIDYWRECFERYRAVMQLDWGRDPPRFAGDTDALKRRLETAITGLLIARRRAADRRLEAARQLVDKRRHEDAKAAYDDALEHITAAIATAAEFAPEEGGELHDRLATIDSEIESLPDPDGKPTTAATDVDAATAAESENADTGSNGEPETVTGSAADRAPTGGGTTVVRPGFDADERERYVRKLQTLGDGQAALAVSVVWRELGWRIDRIDGEQVDLIATRPGEERSLALSIRRRGVPVTSDAVEALVTVCDRRDSDLSPVLVTTDPISTDAFEAAMARGVTLVDSLRLGELARVTGVRPDGIDDALER